MYPSSHGLIQQNVGRFDISVDYRRNSLKKIDIFLKRCIEMVNGFRNLSYPIMKIL